MTRVQASFTLNARAGIPARRRSSAWFQLWVNLPGRDKMMRPRYQEIPAANIPVAHSPTLSNGQSHSRRITGCKAVIETRIPIIYLHFTLQPGGTVTQGVPAEFSVFAYL